MKKIAFMFAAAAMFAACGNEVALTAEDSAAVEQALNDSIAAEVAAIAAPALDTAAVNKDSAQAAFQAAAEKYTKDTAAIFATKEARLAANLAACLAEKQNAEKGDTAANSEEEAK